MFRFCVVGFLAMSCSGGSTSGDQKQDGGVGQRDAQASLCPEVAPESGDDCTGIAVDTRCTYVQCETVGQIDAYCAAGSGEGNIGPRWQLQTAPCEESTCESMTCPAGTVCLANASGAFIIDCVVPECGDGPLSCACMCPGTECEESQSGDIRFTCISCTDCP